MCDFGPLQVLTVVRIRKKLTFRSCSSVFAWSFCPHRAALAATSKLYDGVDDALHRLVRVSNQRGRDLEALGRLAGLVDKLEKVCEGGRRCVVLCFFHKPGSCHLLPVNLMKPTE